MGRLGWVAGALAACLVACSTEVVHGLDERSANQAVAALAQGGVAAEKARDESASAVGRPVYTIQVAASQAARALELLRAAELPREAGSGLAELYQHSSLLPTALEERARLAAAQAGELARTLEAVEGVVQARVHLALPAAADTGDANRSPPSASVLLKVRGAGGAPISTAEVQRLVAGALGGIQPSTVEVVMVRGAEQAAAVTPEVVAVGPLRVERGSRGGLQALLVGLLALIIALSLALVVGARRVARLRDRVAELERRRGSQLHAIRPHSAGQE
jgi:type III secretion protein J